MSKTQDFEQQDKEYIANTYGRFNVCFEKGKGSLLWDVEGKEYIYCVAPMEMVKREGDLYTFQVTHSLSNAGSFKVAYRMFPKHPELPYRQDFCYVRWFNE